MTIGGAIASCVFGIALLHGVADAASGGRHPLPRREVFAHWLRQIGFQDVDCYFKAFELALFGGRKPPQKSINDFD